MKNVDVVIGLNYGDEGKGLTTDWLAERQQKKGNVVVVRFNGGAQAGHTVQLADGTRHVFHHFGAGTFAGAATVLSRFFVVNPVLFFHEAAVLGMLISGKLPKVSVDPRCPVTTPYEVAINQALEKSRTQRHGSCGIGFGETLEREENGVSFTVKDIVDGRVDYKLAEIKKYYKKRMKELGLKTDRKQLGRDLKLFVSEAKNFVKYTVCASDTVIIKLFDSVIFEGAQGLSLDQYSPDFPYVTRSSTGLENVGTILRETDYTDSVSVYYITRAYLTRHGEGPFVEEITGHGLVDATNQPNEYQGSLRFGKLDYDRMASNVARDLVFMKNECVVSAVVTWCDKVAEITDTPLSEIIHSIKHAVGAKATYASYGPTRHDLLPWSATYEYIRCSANVSSVDSKPEYVL